MSSSTPLATGRHIASILWFPFLFAIALPLIFELAFHAPQPHQVPIAVVGSASQVEALSNELHSVNSGGFRVEQVRSQTAAVSAVRDRDVAAAYLETSPSHPVLYVAKDGMWGPPRFSRKTAAVAYDGTRGGPPWQS